MASEARKTYEALLIKEVGNRQCLYDSVGYYSKEERGRAWNAITTTITSATKCSGLTVKKCMGDWNKIRTNYKKNGANHPYSERLKFLDPHIAKVTFEAHDEDTIPYGMLQICHSDEGNRHFLHQDSDEDIAIIECNGKPSATFSMHSLDIKPDIRTLKTEVPEDVPVKIETDLSGSSSTNGIDSTVWDEDQEDRRTEHAAEEKATSSFEEKSIVGKKRKLENDSLDDSLDQFFHSIRLQMKIMNSVQRNSCRKLISCAVDEILYVGHDLKDRKKSR